MTGVVDVCLLKTSLPPVTTCDRGAEEQQIEMNIFKFDIVIYHRREADWNEQLQSWNCHLS